MHLPTSYANVLIDLVEARLAQLMVNGCEDRRELMALKRCRRELRAARTDPLILSALHPARGHISRPMASVLAQH